MAKRKRDRAHDRSPKFLTDKRTGYLICVYYPDPHTKTRKYLSTGTSVLAEAQAFVENHRDRIGAQRRGHEVAVSKEQGAFTIGQALDLVVSDYVANNRKDAAGTTGRVALVKQELGTVRCATFDLDRLISAREAWEAQGKKKGTINRYVALVRRGFKLASERKRIAQDIDFTVPFFNEKPFIRKGFVSQKELDLVNAHEPRPASQDLNLWSFWTGMRWGESTALKWEDFDADTFTIRLHGTDAKSGDGRVLPLPAGPLRDLIARRLADRQGEFIFQHEGDPLTDGERWGKAWHRAGLPCRPMTMRKDRRLGRHKPAKLFHDLRRTGVRNLVRALVAAGVGSPERTAMLVSGHKTRRIFERYNIVEEHEVGPALVALTQYHAAQAGPRPPARVLKIAGHSSRPVDSSTPAGHAGQTARRDRRAG